jgi:hypothetical protein
MIRPHTLSLPTRLNTNTSSALPDLPNIPRSLIILTPISLLIGTMLIVAIYASVVHTESEVCKKNTIAAYQPLRSNDTSPSSIMALNMASPLNGAYSFSVNTPLTPSFPPGASLSSKQNRRRVSSATPDRSRNSFSHHTSSHDLESQLRYMNRSTSISRRKYKLKVLCHIIDTFFSMFMRLSERLDEGLDRLAAMIVTWTRDDGDEDDLIFSVGRASPDENLDSWT